jgi:hypothetical protein
MSCDLADRGHWVTLVASMGLMLTAVACGDSSNDPNGISMSGTGAGRGGRASTAGNAGTAGEAADSGSAATGGYPSEGRDAGMDGAPAGGGDGSSGMTDRQYCDAVALVFIPRCGGGSCHNRPNTTLGDFAVGPEEASSYVDVPSGRNAECGLIIDSTDPAESLIYRKLVGDFGAMCGGFMPVSGGDLTDEQINCVADWVQQFAR